LNSVIQTTRRATATTSTTTANTVTPQQISVGELVARFLSQCGVQAAFGVISIHNMPILDAFHRLGQVRFVPARGEQGATGMADAYARVSGGLGVVITSTGTAAGNTCGAMVEAQTAGTPLLHITGQVELPFLDRNLAYIHEARDQMSMMKSLCKSAWRIWDAQSALGVLRAAVRDAMNAPAGPVGLEIPIDVQEMLVDLPDDLSPLPLPGAHPDAAALDALAVACCVVSVAADWLSAEVCEGLRSIMPAALQAATSASLANSTCSEDRCASVHHLTTARANLRRAASSRATKGSATTSAHA
jgi:acetolactate synthase-1/2/3 large subunit